MRLQVTVASQQEMQRVPVRADEQKAVAASLVLAPSRQLLRILNLRQNLLQLLLQLRGEERLGGLGVALESSELLGCDSSINSFDDLGAGLAQSSQRGTVFCGFPSTTGVKSIDASFLRHLAQRIAFAANS